MSTQTQWILEQIRNTDRATGADFSHHKGTLDLSDIDMGLFKAVMDFCVLRAGYGAQNGGIYKDTRFDANYAILSDIGMPLGAYWYFSSQSSWEAQHRKFMEYCEGKKFAFWVLDVEKYYNTSTLGFATGAIAFLTKLQLDHPDQKVILYANKYDYQDLLYKYTKEVNNWPLWIAQYPWRSWVSGLTEYFKTWWLKLFGGEKKPYMPAGRLADDWEIWQMVDASGVGRELGFDSDELDFNITRRSKEDFYKWLGFDQEEDEPDVGEPSDVGMYTIEQLKEATEAGFDAGYKQAWAEMEMLASNKKQ